MISRCRSIWAVLLLVVLLTTMPACGMFTAGETNTPVPDGSPEPEETAPIPSPTPLEPQVGGTLIVAVPEDPDALNPALATNLAAKWVLSTVDARMVRIRDDNTYEPQLLKAVPSVDNGRISPDGLTYTLRFHEDLAWSDGEPLDARDLVFTWQAMTNPAFPVDSRVGWELIQAISVSDDYLTATIRLREPSATFLEDVIVGGSDDVSGFLLPAHVLEDEPVSEIPTHLYGGEEHIGSGPFRIQSWEPGTQLVVERNDHFRGPEPRLDRIVFRVVPDTRDAIDYLSTGEVDLAVALPETALADIAAVPDLHLWLPPIGGAVELYYLNLNDPNNLGAPHPILGDPAVRWAIVLGFNRQAVVDNLLKGQTSLAASILDHTRWMADGLAAYPYDRQQAERTLDRAGWRRDRDGIRVRNGVRLSFTHTTALGDDPDAVLRQRIQAAFIEDMRAIGIEVVQRNVPAAQLRDRYRLGNLGASREFDVVDLGHDTYTELVRVSWRFHSSNIPRPDDSSGGNLMGYRNPRVDWRLAGLAQAIDADRRQILAAEVQRLIYDDVPVIPVYDHFQVHAGQQFVHGLQPGPMSGLWWNTEKWWVNPDVAVP